MNHTMAQMLAMVVNERQDDWDLRLPHIEFAYDNSVSAATGLAPNAVHVGTRLPETVFERTGVAETRVWPSITWPTATLLRTDSSARTIMSQKAMPSPFPVLTAETPPLPTRCARSLNVSWVVGHGCTTQLPPSARA